MQRGHFLRRIDPDQLFENRDQDGDVVLSGYRDDDGDVIISERSLDDALCCQCPTGLSREDDQAPTTKGKKVSQLLDLEVKRTSSSEEDGAKIVMGMPRPRRAHCRSGYLPSPVVIDDSEDENRLVTSDDVSSVFHYNDGEYRPNTRARKRSRRA